ncbi:uncharacterized protein [Argopecten irradians]|uniref:uncharacterized protein isoform X2 n=1 Tax=Argopecten irradians TaxID=31199 RepID=UPI00371A2FB4
MPPSKRRKTNSPYARAARRGSGPRGRGRGTSQLQESDHEVSVIPELQEHDRSPDGVQDEQASASGTNLLSSMPLQSSISASLEFSSWFVLHL